MKMMNDTRSGSRDEPGTGIPVAVRARAAPDLCYPLARPGPAAVTAMTSQKPTADDISELLQATAGGDRAAFARLYQVTSPRLLAIAYRLLGRRDAAEDVLQDVFITVWSKAGQHTSDQASAYGWMAAITRHRAIDRLRSETAQSRHVDAGADAQTVGPQNCGPQRASDMVVRERRMDGCLAALQAQRRNALLLAYYYGHTHDELSQRLGVPLGTVKSWIRRSLLQLRECLES